MSTETIVTEAGDVGRFSGHVLETCRAVKDVRGKKKNAHNRRHHRHKRSSPRQQQQQNQQNQPQNQQQNQQQQNQQQNQQQQNQKGKEKNGSYSTSTQRRRRSPLGIVKKGVYKIMKNNAKPTQRLWIRKSQKDDSPRLRNVDFLKSNNRGAVPLMPSPAQQHRATAEAETEDQFDLFDYIEQPSQEVRKPSTVRDQLHLQQYLNEGDLCRHRLGSEEEEEDEDFDEEYDGEGVIEEDDSESRANTYSSHSEDSCSPSYDSQQQQVQEACKLKANQLLKQQNQISNDKAQQKQPAEAKVRPSCSAQTSTCTDCCNTKDDTACTLVSKNSQANTNNQECDEKLCQAAENQEIAKQQIQIRDNPQILLQQQKNNVQELDKLFQKADEYQYEAPKLYDLISEIKKLLAINNNGAEQV